jgi:ribonuclease P protein component
VWDEKTAQRKRFCDKANFPAEHQAPQAEAWISSPDEDAGRSRDPQSSPSQGPSQVVGVTSDLVANRRSLKSRREFQRVIEKGRAVRRNGITVFVGNYDPEMEPRLGLAVRERGSAVRRNRVRRRLRAATALCRLPHRDVVIRADGSVADMEFQELVKKLESALAAAA